MGEGPAVSGSDDTQTAGEVCGPGRALVQGALLPASLLNVVYPSGAAAIWLTC